MSPTEVFILHFKAMFLKRWLYGKRDHVSIAFTTILPVGMLFAGLLLLKYGEADGGFANQGLRPLVLSQFHEDCEETKSCEFPDSPVPFLVASDRWGEHPERTAEVLSRIQAQPFAAAEPVAYRGALETGMQWKYGIQYEDGLPTCDVPVYRPRADVQDWVDPRHRFFVDQEKIADPGVCLSFADEVFKLGDGTSDTAGQAVVGSQYGSLLFHDELQQSGRDICHMPSAVGTRNGLVTGGDVPAVSCTISLMAPAGLTVQLKVIASRLRSNSVSVYNSTTVAPENLVTVLTGRDGAGQVISSGTNVLTLVESETQGSSGETWSMYWSFVEACVDLNDACPEVIDQIAAFGFNCDTHLDEVDPDTIAFPPMDVRTGEPVPLPRNPITGRDFTEPEFRQLASLYLPQLQQQYVGRSLAEFCPVSCVETVCSTQDPGRGCVTQNRCGASTCPSHASAITTAAFFCSANELVNEVALGGCAITQPVAGFCESSCFAAVGPWLAHCEGQGAAVLNEIYEQSFVNWVTISAVLRVANGAQCDVRSLQRQEANSAPPGGITVVSILPPPQP